jgi:Domain of unknown function (DUF4349)
MIGRIQTTPRRRWLAFLALVAIVAGCSSGATVLSTVGNSVGSESVGSGRAAGPAPAAQPAVGASGPGKVVGDGTVTAPSDLLVIKTGTLALQVKGIDASLSQASQKIAALDGFVSGSQRSGDGESAVATVTYRIPAARWDDALVALRGLAEKVLGEDTQTAEVTGQVLDLGARITNLQATERALQAIMARAVKISDVLEVQAQLTEVRGQIEELQTQKAHLEEQAAYGTLEVTFGIETVAVVEAQKGFDPAAEADRAAASLVEIGQALAAAGIWFAILWLPILVVVGLMALVAFLVFRRFRRTRAGAGDGGTGGPGMTTPGPISPPAEA